MLLPSSHPSQHNPNVPISFCCRDPVPLYQLILGSHHEGTSRLQGIVKHGWSASAAGTHLVQSLGCLVPHLQSPLHLGRSPSSLHLCRKCSWETSSPYCGYSQMEEEEMADGFADYLQVPSEAQLVSHFTCASCLLIASCKPPGINPVMCLTQRSQKLFPPCLDLEARPEINPDQCFVHSYSL